MKDKHNVILILVSSSLFNSCFPEWLVILFLVSNAHLFFPGVPSSNYHSKDLSKSLQGFTLYFQLLFLFVWSFFCYRSFFMEAIHDGSSRILFLLEVFIEILFKELKHSSSRIPKCISFLPYHWRWYYVILDNFPSCFVFHKLSRMRYFKLINLFVGIILGYVSPKAFPMACCYLCWL